MFSTTYFSQPALKISILIATILALSLAQGCATNPDRNRNQSSTSFVFWPTFPNEPHIQFLTSYAYSSDVDPASKSNALERIVFGKQQDAGILPIRKPYGVDMWNGIIYVCDLRGSAVVVLDLVKHQTRLMGISGMNALNRPTDIAIADDGTKYVTDLPNGVVVVFDSNDRFKTVFGQPGLEPVGIAIHDNELYVTDSKTSQVLVLNRHTGKEVRRIGKLGPTEDGGLAWPLGIDLDSKSNVYVSDALAALIQTYSPDGQYQRAIGRLGTEFGAFVRPKCIAIDSKDRLFAVDAAFSNVQVFNNEGRLLTFFGSQGKFPGAMAVPAGICIEPLNAQTQELFGSYVHPAFQVEEFIIVTNQWGSQKVQVFALGELKEGMTTADIAPNRIDIQSSGIADVPIPPGTEEDPAPTPSPGNQHDSESR